MLHEEVVMTLPSPLFNVATHHEDATVELMLLRALSDDVSHQLRVLTIAGCGTHALAMCSIPEVAQIDAVDISSSQLKLGALLATATQAVYTPEEMAIFVGNDGSALQRQELYAKVREFLRQDLALFWDENLDIVKAGVLRCGGTERLLAKRAYLPTQDLQVLASRPQFLRPDVFAAMKSYGCGADRLSWHEGPVQEVGAALAWDHGFYDFMDLSNILSAASEASADILYFLLRWLRPGGVFLCRGSQALGTLSGLFTSCGLEVDVALSSRAVGAESSFLHQDICVARKPG